MFKELSLSLLALVSANTFAAAKFSSPPNPADSQFVGAWMGTYAEQAAESVKSGSRWVPSQFCLGFGDSHDLVRDRGCDPDLLQKSHSCAIQNLKAGKWDAGFLNLPVEVFAPALVNYLTQSQCSYLILDIESLPGTQRENYSKWITQLRPALLKLAPALKMGISAHAKTEPKGDWDGAQSQDWKVLCDNSDELIIMAYDFNYPGSTDPGETAPLEWVEKVLTYGKSACTADKLRLGMAAYGYRWPTTAVLTERERLTQGPPLLGIVETEEKRAEKIELATTLGIKKFFLWALGMERLPVIVP